MAFQNNKRRASKACLRCRARKVRCNVNEGLPCLNCRLDGIECKVTQSTRRCKHRVEGLSRRENNISIQYSNIDNLRSPHPSEPVANGNDTEAPESSHGPTVNDEQMINATPTSPTYNQDRWFSTVTGASMDPDHLRANVDSRRLDAGASAVNTGKRIHNRSSHSYSPLSFAHDRLGSTAAIEASFPHFIRRTSVRLDEDDIQHLQRKGAFNIPDTSLRNDLLRCYVQYVHTYLPVLELESFLTAIEKNEATNTISLLLFQAVMFAATPYVAPGVLAAHGYPDRRKARRSFYLRAKLLCDMDYEPDRLTVIQSSLLMTYWNEAPDDPKDVWYWLGVAISLSNRMGLNYRDDLVCCTSHNLMERRLSTRIWWSCYMRDRLVSLAFRRPARIRQNEFDQPMLQLSDFETKPLSAEVSDMLGSKHSAFKDEATRKSLAKLCIAMAKLTVCLTPILAMQCRKIDGNSALHSMKQGVHAYETPVNMATLLQCDDNLRNWYQKHAEDLRCFNGGSSCEQMGNGSQILDLQKAVLKGVYLASLSTLHRPQILSSTRNTKLDSEIRELSRRKTHEAANELTILYTSLYAHGLVGFLPNTGVTCLLHAAIIHVLDQMADDSDLQQSAKRKFGLCMQALEQLGEIYGSGAFACSFLIAAAKKASSRPETTEAIIGLCETVPGADARTIKALSHFECQFNVSPLYGSSKDVSRVDTEEISQTVEVTAPIISNAAVWQQYEGGLTQGNSATTDGLGNENIIMDGNNSNNNNKDAVRGNFRMVDGVQSDLDWMLNVEGSADIFDLSDGLGAPFATQWFDSL